MPNVKTDTSITNHNGFVEGTIKFRFCGLLTTIFVAGERVQLALTKAGLVRIGRKLSDAGIAFKASNHVEDAEFTIDYDNHHYAIVIDYTDGEETIPSAEDMADAMEIVGEQIIRLAKEDKLEVFYR